MLRGGVVTAVEIDGELAGRAQDNLSVYKNVVVVKGDASCFDVPSSDVIL